MVDEAKIQSFVHGLEEGGLAKWIRFALLLALILGMATYLIISKFGGLSTADGMDQAQIAREISRGHGFSTLFYRPAVYAQIMANRGEFRPGPLPDTYHAPLNPFINSFALRLAPETWKWAVYTPDRAIAMVSIFFFALAVGVNYLVIRRIFDHIIGLLSVSLVLICETFWRLSLSGLPQMLMLLIFSCCMYMMVRAIEAKYEEKQPLGWLAAAGVLFGLLALAHAITIWIFVGALVFSAIFFRPRGRDTVLMLLAFLIVYGPWLLRTYAVSGSPGGIALHTVLYQMVGDFSTIMRQMYVDFSAFSPSALRGKMQNQALAQLGAIYSHLGRILVAPLFFVGLLHLFRRPATGVFRWAVLLMWLGGFTGMCVFGLRNENEDPNDLHVLFIPLMTAYGLAFLLVLWTRLNINIRLARIALLVFIFLVSGAPMAVYLLQGGLPLHWPPYAPPYIAAIKDWMDEDEIVASDMPWAVAWYADRRSLWVPMTVKEFVDLNDYNQLHGPILGLYLTPITGYKPFISDIVRGEWKEWAPMIMRSSSMKNFPLTSMLGMPGEGVFFSDRPRWQDKPLQPLR